jgi:hypothetical protein
MMNSHPDLFVFRETHWIPGLYKVFGTEIAPTEKMLDIVARTHFITGESVTEIDDHAFKQSRYYRPDMSVVDFCNAVGMYFAERDSKLFWADKTPDYGYFISMLQLYWPECKIIHVIRDGVRTAESMSQHIGYRGLAAQNSTNWCSLALDFVPPEEGFPSSPMSRFADLWRIRLERIRDEAKCLAPDSYLEIRFEELASEPRRNLCQIARWVGLSETESWLANAISMVDNDRGKSRFASEKVPDYFTKEHRQLLRDLGYPFG